MHTATYQAKIEAIYVELNKYAQEKIMPVVEEVKVDMMLVNDLKQNIARGIEDVDSAKEVLRVQGYNEETINRLIK
jgi:anti-sigma28 factor (negative regulator of flagellin synthesis)